MTPAARSEASSALRLAATVATVAAAPVSVSGTAVPFLTPPMAVPAGGSV